jgi:hypothetical protein
MRVPFIAAALVALGTSSALALVVVKDFPCPATVPH